MVVTVNYRVEPILMILIFVIVLAVILSQLSCECCDSTSWSEIFLYFHLKS